MAKAMRMLLSFFMGTLSVVFFLILLLYLAGSIPSWVEKGVQLLHEETGIAIELSGFSGNLWRDFSFTHLTLKLEGFNLNAENGHIRWQPKRLWRKTIVVESLKAQKLVLTFGGSDGEGAGPPTDIGLPFYLQAHAHVQELIIASGSEPLRFTNVKMDYAYQDEAHQIDFLESQTPWGEVLAQKLSLGGKAPFKATGHVHFTPMPDIVVDGEISGSLLNLALDANLRLNDVPSKAKANLRLWEEEWLTVIADLDNIDPKAWQASLPAGRFAIRAAASVRNDIYRVDITAKNDNPGPLDHDLWPLHALDAKGHGHLDDFHIDTFAGYLAQGKITAQGQIGKDMAFDFKLEEIDAKNIVSSLWQTAISGQAHLRIENHTPTLKADLHDQGFNLLVDLAQKDGKTLADVQLAKGPSKIKGQGTLDANNRFDFNALLAHVDPSLFGDYPKADLNGQLKSFGRINPLQIEGHIDLAKSQLETYPLSLQGKVAYGDNRINLALNGLVANNRLEMQGALGRPRDVLNFSFFLPKLDAISPDLAGEATINGHVQGDFETPALFFVAKASKLRYNDITMTALNMQGEASLKEQSPLSLQLEAINIEKDELRLAKLSANVNGKLEQHRLVLDVHDHNELLAHLVMAGGYNGKSWSGQLENLTMKKPLPLQSLASAPLHFSAEAMQLGPFSLALGQSRLALAVWYKNGRWESEGKIEHLALADVQSLLPPDIEGDLSLTGQWQIHYEKGITGNFQLARQGGDLKAGPDAIALKLQQLSIQAQAKDHEATINVQAQGQRLGLLHADMALLGPLRFPIDRNNKIAGALAMDMGEISWISAFLPRDLYVAGRVGGAVNIRGTLAKPEFYGAMTANHLALTVASEGIFWPEGHLKTSWRNNAIHLDELVFEDSDKGRLQAQGQAVIDNGIRFSSKIFLSHFKVLERPDRFVVASGNVSLKGGDQGLGATGKITIDKADINIATPEGVTYASDVVVKGEPKPPAKPFPIRLALQLQLGDQVKIAGMGINTHLTGQLNIAAKDERMPEAYGQIHLVNGEYQAYGQNLIIDQGTLNFIGPIENPALNIRAIRPHLTRTVGVQITGTANAPVVQLVSDPPLSDSDALSWLVLGHGLSAATEGDASILVGVASSLFGRGEAAKIQGILASKLGLEEIDVKSGDTLEGTVLSLGKRLSSRLYVYYEQSIATVSNIVRLRYDLTPRWSIETSAGDESAIDVFYNMTFD